MTDALAGFAPASVTGEGWICTLAGQNIVCARSDGLAHTITPIGAGITGTPGGLHSAGQQEGGFRR